MNEEKIKEIVALTLEELINEKLINRDNDMCYKFMSKKLFKYFADGVVDNQMEHGLNALEEDPWYKILILYYEDRKTTENVAEELGCAITTIVRNKKRLVLRLYDLVYPNGV